jgi:hypothetical protein
MAWAGTSGGVRVVVEAGFETLMVASEIRSLAQQVHRCYSLNLHCPLPAQGAPPAHMAGPARLALGGCDGQLLAAIRRIRGWENWGLRGLAGGSRVIEVDPEQPADSEGGTGDDVATLSVSELLRESGTPTVRRLVVLSPDADIALEGVAPEDVYMIGGLCDSKRIFGASLRRAAEIGAVPVETEELVEVCARRLPLVEWAPALAVLGREQQRADPVPDGQECTKPAWVEPIAMSPLPFVDILTVDQVFHLLLLLANNGNDWLNALATMLPPRKLAALRDGGDETNKTAEPAGGVGGAALAGMASHQILAEEDK